MSTQCARKILTPHQLASTGLRKVDVVRITPAFAVEGAFGGDIDYAMLIKLYGAAPESIKGRYSPAECIGIRKRRIEGDPDPKHVSTSYAERQNLTMRMAMRRFTRLTNAFCKKFENHVHMVAIYTV